MTNQAAIGTTTTTRTLRAIRESVELTQKDLAEMSDISLTTISSIENGSSAWATHEGVAWALADALYVSVDDIEWPHGLSSNGRPPHTHTKRGEISRTNSQESVEDTCTECWVIPAVNGKCNC